MITVANNLRCISRIREKNSGVMNFIVISALLFVFFPYPSIGQQLPQKAVEVPYTLNQVFNSISKLDKSVNLERLRLLVAAENIEDIRKERLPDLDITGDFTKLSNLPQYENGLFERANYYPLTHTTYSFGSSLYLNIYNGNNLNRKLEAAKISKNIGERKIELTLSEIKLVATGYYLDLIRDQRFLSLLLQDIQEQRKVALQITSLYKSGVVLKSDVLRAELKISKQILQSHQIENRIALTSQKLNLLMGQQEEEIIKAEENIDNDSLKINSYQSYFAMAIKNSHEIGISRLQQEVKKIGIRDAKSIMLPKIGFYADYGYNYPQGRFYPYSLSVYGLGTAGIRISYPLSALYKGGNRIVAAKLEMSEQSLENLRLEDEIKNRIRESVLALKDDAELISVSRSNIIQATENERILKNSYFNQTALITDYLDAQLQLLQSRFDLASAQISAQYHFYQLQKTIGKL